MISKLAVDNFLNRKLEEHLWIKECEKDELLKAIGDIGKLPPLKHEPWKHQLASIYLGMVYPNFLYFLDMGLGKTFISLNLIMFYKSQNLIKKCLVVVPNVVNIEGWKEEINEHTDLKCSKIEGTKAQRIDALNKNADIYVINYAGLQTMMTELKEMPSKGKKAKRKRMIDKSLSETFASNFDMVVLDEIHKCSDHKSLTYKLCDYVCKHCDYRYGLTGTPIGRDPQHFWAQFYLIDRGATLGTTLTMYRQAYFEQKKGFWGGFEYSLNEKMKPKLHKSLSNRSIRYADTECQDLPKLLEIDMPMRMSKDAIQFYKEFIKVAIEQAKNPDVTQKQNTYTKFRQIASGFFYTENEGVKTPITFSSNEKLDSLQELIEDMPSNSKMVVFHIFNKSSDLIVERLKKLKIKHTCINGNIKDKVGNYKRFKNDPSIKILVVNIVSGGTGLNLQNANYMVFYEPIDRPREFSQAKKRCHRSGQTKRTYSYNFVTMNSVEEKIMEFLAEGKSLTDSLVEGKINFNELSGL